jgi:hypothetical protein
MLRSRMSGAIPLLFMCLYGVDRENFFTFTRPHNYATEILVEEEGLRESNTILKRKNIWTYVQPEILVYSVSARTVVLGEVPGSNTFPGIVYLNPPINK